MMIYLLAVRRLIYTFYTFTCCISFIYFVPQIAKLTEKYDLLEKQVQKLRNQSKNEVTTFLDKDIGTKLDKISRGVKKIDTRIFTYHQVNFAAHSCMT